MSEITGFQLNQEIRRLAAESPDFVYRPEDPDTGSCVYVVNGVGSCIVGRALVNLGVDPEWLTEDISITLYPKSRNSERFEKIAGDIPGLVATDDEIQWANAVQESQDLESRWGVAVLDADAQVIV